MEVLYSSTFCPTIASSDGRGPSTEGLGNISHFIRGIPFIRAVFYEILGMEIVHLRVDGTFLFCGQGQSWCQLQTRALALTIASITS